MTWLIIKDGQVRAETQTRAAAIAACRETGLIRWFGPATGKKGTPEYCPGIYERPIDGVEIRKARA